MFCLGLAVAIFLQPGDDRGTGSFQEQMRSFEKARTATKAARPAEKMSPTRYRALVQLSNTFAREVAGENEERFESVAEAALTAAIKAELGQTREPTVGLVPVPVEPLRQAGVRAVAPALAPASDSFERDPEYLANFRFLRTEAAKEGSDLFPLPPPGARIIGFGSRPATANEFPDCVAVGSMDADGPAYCCTGTLVAPNLVVTAGHCWECASDAVVFIGSDVQGAGATYRGRVVRHPEYGTSKHNDLSVIVLNQNVANVTPRRIAPAGSIDRARSVRAVGFGNTNAAGSRGYGIKRLVDVPVATTGCSRPRDPSRYGCDRGLELVAIGPNNDTCTGDSGGPVYVRDRLDNGRWGEWMLAGATSRAIRNSANVCGDGGVYVRLDKYSAFIDAQRGGGAQPDEEDSPLAAPEPFRANERGTIVAPDGRKYRVLRSPERNAELDREFADEDNVRSTVPVADRYKGKARKKAKLSVANADLETFATVKKLLASLPRDERMEDFNISTGENSGRVDVENRNLGVRAFLFAASAENDRDFHLIIGDKGTRPKFMTVEVSGLAADGSSADSMVRARQNFKALFTGPNQNLIPGSSYDFYDPPIPVDVAGSLFWDASHENGTKPGPSQRKPVTVFELHPVTKFEYISN